MVTWGAVRWTVSRGTVRPKAAAKYVGRWYGLLSKGVPWRCCLTHL